MAVRFKKQKTTKAAVSWRLAIAGTGRKISGSPFRCKKNFL